MLNPSDRKLYADCLEPPEGYRFDCGVATSFTLGLEPLLALPFTLATNHAAEPDAVLANKAALLQSLHEVTDHLTVFCHEGYIGVPRKRRLLYSYLEDCVVPVRAEHAAGVFHPKVWVLRFHDGDGGWLLRVVVLSRNLTYDRSWDIVLCLDGEPTGRRCKDSYELADLLDALPSLAVQPLAEHRLEAVRDLAEDVRHTRFDVPEPFRGHARFHLVGIGGREFDPRIDGYGDRVLCVSPFVSPGALTYANGFVRSEAVLVARSDELDRCADALDGWKCFVLSDDIETGDEGDAPETEEDALRALSPSGLHAKLFLVQDGRGRTTWWVGSLNHTTAAWEGRNVELMVELTGTKDVSIDAVWDDGLGKMTTPYTPSPPSEEVLAQRAASDLADEARRAITQAALSLLAEPRDGAWDLTLRGAVSLPEGTTAVAWPLSLNEANHAQELSPPILWAGVEAASLTALVAVEVRAKKGDARSTVRFALKLHAEGFPDDRHAHILRRLLDNQTDLFRYLRFLLAPTESESVLELLEPIERADPDARDEGAALLGLQRALLEDILRASSRDPGRLEHVERVVDDLSKTDEGRALVPAELRHVLGTVRSAIGGPR